MHIALHSGPLARTSIAPSHLRTLPHTLCHGKSPAGLQVGQERLSVWPEERGHMRRSVAHNVVARLTFHTVLCCGRRLGAAYSDGIY